MASESASLSSSVPSPSLQNLTKAKIEDLLLHHGADALLEAILVPEVRVAREPVVLLFEVLLGHHFPLSVTHPSACRDNIPVLEAPAALAPLIRLLPSCIEELQMEVLASLKFLCGCLRNKDVFCTTGAFGLLLEVVDELQAHFVFEACISLIQLLGRHHVSPEDVRKFLAVVRNAHAERNEDRMNRYLGALKAMTKHVEPGRVFDFDGGPEVGILVPQFKLNASNGYTISFWLHSDAVSTENANREQRLLSMLNDDGDGLLLSLMPQRRAAHTILCAALHSKKNITTQVFEANPIQHHKWVHIALVHSPSRLFQRRSELKLYLNGVAVGSKSLAFLETTRAFTHCCWGTDPFILERLVDPGRSLRGQLTCLGIFNDSLSEEKIMLLYSTLPDNYKHLMTTSNLAESSIALYHPNVPPGNVIYDLAGQKHGVGFGSLRIIRSMSLREAILAAGGVELLFPLLLDLDKFTDEENGDKKEQAHSPEDDLKPIRSNPASESESDSSPARTHSSLSSSTDRTLSDSPSPYSPHIAPAPSPTLVVRATVGTFLQPQPVRAKRRPPRKASPSDPTINLAAEVIDTLANVVHNSHALREDMLQQKSLRVLALLLERLPEASLDIRLLDSLGTFIGALSSPEDETLANSGLKYLLWNMAIWARPSFEIQQQHHKFLMAHIQSKRVNFRSHFGIPFLLNLLRTYPSKPGNLDGTSAPEESPALTLRDLSHTTADSNLPATAKTLLTSLAPADTGKLRNFPAIEIADLRHIVVRMMEIETDHLLTQDEMFALLGTMTTSDDACEIIDASKFLLSCFQRESRHNYQVLVSLGDFYVLLPMLESREEAVRLLGIQLLRKVVHIFDGEKEKIMTQIAVALSLALSSFPITLSTYYALMALMLGDSVEVDWKCEYKVRSGSAHGDLVSRIQGFPDLDGSQTIRHPEILHVIFDLLSRPDKRGSAASPTQGWALVVRALQDFRLLLVQRPPDQQAASGAAGIFRKRAPSSLPVHMRNWSIFQNQPDWLDHLLLLLSQSKEFISTCTKIPSDASSQSSDGSSVSSSQSQGQSLVATSSSPTSDSALQEAAVDTATLAKDMLVTMINNLVMWPILEKKDGWKVVQASEVAVYRFEAIAKSRHLPFDALKTLKNMYRSLLSNLKIEMERLFTSSQAPQKYPMLWENIPHLCLLVEEYLFYQPKNKAALTIRDPASATASELETITRQNTTQLRCHMHRSLRQKCEVPVVTNPPSRGNPSPQKPHPPSSSTTTLTSASTTISPPGSETLATSLFSSAPASMEIPKISTTPSSGKLPMTSSDNVTSPTSTTNQENNAQSSDSIPSGLTTSAGLIQVQVHASFKESGNAGAANGQRGPQQLGKWKDFEVAQNLFDFLDYVLPQSEYTSQILHNFRVSGCDIKQIHHPSAGDMSIIEAWLKTDTGKDWGKEKHKILVTATRALVTTLFDAELILNPTDSSLRKAEISLPPPHSSSSTPSSSDSGSSSSVKVGTSSNFRLTDERPTAETVLKKRDAFFVNAILRLHRLIVQLYKNRKEGQSAITQPLAGLAFAISSMSSISAANVGSNDPPFIEVFLFCICKLIKFITMTSERPAWATTNVFMVIKEVMAKWIDSNYFEGAFPKESPEPNPFAEQRNIFDKRAPNEALIHFMQDLTRLPKHQIWRNRINRALSVVEQGAVVSIRPMMARRDSQAYAYNSALEKVQMDRTNDTPIFKATRTTNQKLANAYYATSAMQKQKTIAHSESMLRLYYRMFHQLHEADTIWHGILLRTPLSDTGTPFFKLDKAEQRPRMRRKIKHNYLGSQHLKASHEYYKQQWAKEIEVKRQNATSSKSSSLTSLPTSPLVSPPLSPSPSFVAEARMLPLAHASGDEELPVSIAPSSSLNKDIVITADQEIEMLMEEVSESEFKDIDAVSDPLRSTSAISPTPSSSNNAGAPDLGSTSSGQPQSHLQGQRVVYSSPCELILPEVKILGRIFVTKKRIYFQHDAENAKVIEPDLHRDGTTSPRTSELSASMVGIKDIGYFNWTRTLFKHKFADHVWKVNNLVAIYCRRYMLSWTAVELDFGDNSKNYFINLPKDENKKLFHALEDQRPPRLKTHLYCTAPQYYRRMHDFTERWKRREISNFDYLMVLNHASGRTMNDLTQYPVFPWILTNYTSERLDLNDPSNYRDLSKPIGALEPSRLEKFVERYENFIDDSIPRFYYGSHYSSAGAVLFYLLRMEPYTSQFICLQGGKFDYPDRLFSSVGESWENCLRSTTDVKELIPEFFYMPEFLVNANRLDLGQKTHATEPINDVVLPPWANNNPHEFVRIHREALESDYVSANLHHWIDLIFGYKQRGKEAVNAYNTFFHVTYEGSVDLTALSSEQRQAMLSQIENFGQTPAQLLTTPHPARDPSPREKAQLMLSRIPLPELMTKIKQTSSRLPFGTTYSMFPIMRSLVLTINPYGEYLLHRWNSQVVTTETSTELVSTFELDTLFSTNSSPHSFPHDASQPAVRHKMVDAFTQRLFPGNRRFPSQSIGIRHGEHGHPPLLFLPYPEDGNYVFSSGHWDGSIHLCLLDDFVNMQTLPVLKLRQVTHAHHLPISCMAISENLLVLGAQDTMASLWQLNYDRKQLKIEKRLYNITGHSAPITSVTINRALDLLVTASQDGLIMLHQLDLKHNRTRAVLRLGGPVTRLAISSLGYIVAYENQHHKMYCFSLNGEKISEKSLFDGEEDDGGQGLSDVVFSKVNPRLVLCAEGSTVVFRSAPFLELVHILYTDNKDSAITSLQLSEDERVLFMASRDGSLGMATLPDWNPDLVVL